MTQPPEKMPITVREAGGLLGKSINAWVDDYAPSMGAAIAYYTLFSIAPLLVIVIAVAGFIFGPEAAEGRIAAQLQEQVGPQVASVVQSLVKSFSKPSEGALATGLSLFTLFLGATSVFGELQSALNRIWRMPDPPRRGAISTLLRVRLRSFGMVFGIGLLILASLLFSTLLSAAGDWSSHSFSGWTTFLQFANFFLSFAINTGLFAMVYKFMPRARIAWRDVAIGATVTSLLFETSKFLISFYLGRGGVGSGFGAASSLVVFLVWVYLSAQIFLLGAEFTWVYAHQRGSRSERRAKKETVAVPSRAGDATPEQKMVEILDPPRRKSYPLTEKYASMAARGIKRSASGAGRLLRRKPVVGLGLLLGLGVIAAAAVRRRASSPPPAPK